MTSLAEQLMAGPRGRALCLYVGLHHGHWRPLWNMALEPDRERGVPWYDAERDRVLTAEQAGLVEELNAGLGGSVEVGAAELRLALEHTVDNAVYWQDPRDEELVGSMPQLAPELRRVAHQIAGLTETDWWTASLTAEQYRVRFLPLAGPATHEESPAQILAEAYRVRAVSEPPGYMSGWWSAPPFGLVRTCPAPEGEPSGLFLVEDGFGQQAAAVYSSTATEPSVFEIASGEAWAALCRDHPLDVTAVRGGDWLVTTALADTRWVMPDWASVAREYDAVHLQVGAYLAASGTAIEVEPGVHSVIAGWAPGDTYWLTDVAEVEPVGRIFVKNRDDDLWHPTEETA